MPRIISPVVALVDEPIFLEHVCKGGKLFQNKREVKSYCKQHGLESGVLL